MRAAVVIANATDLQLKRIVTGLDCRNLICVSHRLQDFLDRKRIHRTNCMGPHIYNNTKFMQRHNAVRRLQRRWRNR